MRFDSNIYELEIPQGLIYLVSIIEDLTPVDYPIVIPYLPSTSFAGLYSFPIRPLLSPSPRRQGIEHILRGDHIHLLMENTNDTQFVGVDGPFDYTQLRAEEIMQFNSDLLDTYNYCHLSEANVFKLSVDGDREGVWKTYLHRRGKI